MRDLIEALQIFLKYKNNEWPTHCEHDELFIIGVGEVSEEDAAKLDKLGFFRNDVDGWSSFKFGSA